MPVEGLETTENTPFTQTTHPFGYLKFLNQSQDDWEKLKIGYHYWLCAELEKFAQAELKGGSLYVRFAACFIAPTVDEENRVIEEIKVRLSDIPFEF